MYLSIQMFNTQCSNDPNRIGTTTDFDMICTRKANAQMLSFFLWMITLKLFPTLYFACISFRSFSFPFILYYFLFILLLHFIHFLLLHLLLLLEAQARASASGWGILYFIFILYKCCFFKHFSMCYRSLCVQI